MQQLEKIHGVHKVLLQFKEISLCFECHSKVRGLFSFFKKYSKTFLQLFDSQKTSSITIKFHRNIAYIEKNYRR